jgi:hypothetical protein
MSLLTVPYVPFVDFQPCCCGSSTTSGARILSTGISTIHAVSRFLTSPRVCLFLYMTTQSYTALSSELNPSRSLRNHASLSCNLFLHSSCKPGSDLIQSGPITGLFHMQSLYNFCTLQACPLVLCKPTRRPKRPKEDEQAIIMHVTCSISSNPSSPARLLSLQLCKPTMQAT